MNVLFINTADGTRALLCVNGNRYYAENYKNAGSETLMPMLNGLIADAGISIKDIDLFGACVGPGSFTGIRIGLTTVKSFCYALGKPCFGVNNLRLNSYNNEGKVISLADAGNKVCYAAIYDGDDEVLSPMCLTLDGAKKLVSEHPEAKVSTDSKLRSVFGVLSSVGEREMLIALQKHSADTLGQAELTPVYIRKSQPERKDGDL